MTHFFLAARWGKAGVLSSVVTLTVSGLGAASAATTQLDGLLAVIDAPSPCLSVRVKVLENGKLTHEVALMPSGVVKPVGSRPTPVPRFAKGKTYNLQATCVSTSGVFQNSELNFTAEGRTVMVVFTKSGFQFKRGGLAY